MERRESFQERRKRQQARRRLLGKLAAVLIGAVFLFGLCKKTADQFLLTGEKKQDSYIGIEDAGHMVWLLADCRQEQPTQALAETTDAAQEFDGDNTQAAVVSAHAAGSRSTPDQVLDLMKKFQAESDDGYLTWTQAKQYFSCLPGSRELFLGGAYTGTERVEEADWYDWFDRAKRKYDAAGRIQEETVVVLGILKGDENGPGDAQESAQAALMREMGTASGGKKDAQSQKTELRILTQNGVRMAASATFLTESMRFCPVRAIVREDCLYAVRNRLTEPVILKNVWMIETTGQSIHGFWKDCEFSGAAAVEVKTDSAEGQRTEENRESDWKRDRKSTTVVSDTAQLSEAVCDLTFETGKPVIVCQKPDKISGRLLGVSRNGAEIEGHGTIPFSEDLQCYRLYGRLSQMDIGELKIGYGFTDFVVEDGTIEAALAVREEKMETIRVLIKTSGYANSVHQAVELFADCDCRIWNVESELTTLEKGQRLVITRDSPLFDQTGRITIEPKILTGHLMLSGVERAQGQANYRGRLELVRREDGIGQKELAERLLPFGYHVEDGNKAPAPLFKDAGLYSVHPDIIIRRDGTIVAILDAKYKPDPKEADRYEVLSFMDAMNVGVGGFVCPAIETDTSRYLGETETGKQLFALRYDLGMVDPGAESDRFAQNVLQIIQGRRQFI